MENILFKKLRSWKKENEAEAKLERVFVGRTERLIILKARLSMLLGVMVTTIVFCVTVLIVHGLK